MKKNSFVSVNFRKFEQYDGKFLWLCGFHEGKEVDFTELHVKESGCGSSCAKVWFKYAEVCRQAACKERRERGADSVSEEMRNADR